MKSKQQLLSHFFIFAAQLVQYRLHLHHVEFSFFFFQTLWLFFFRQIFSSFTARASSFPK